MSLVHYLILCRSLTYAQRTARILERAAINGRVMRAPKIISKEGCGYCVKLGEKKLSEALQVLKRENMSPKQIYLQAEAGELQEVLS